MLHGKSTVSIYFHTEFIYKLVIFTCMLEGASIGMSQWEHPGAENPSAKYLKKIKAFGAQTRNLDEKNPGR